MKFLLIICIFGIIIINIETLAWYFRKKSICCDATVYYDTYDHAHCQECGQDITHR